MPSRDAFLTVPRSTFLPAKIWVDDEKGEPRPIDRATDPDRWHRAAHANVAIVTQFDDGATVWPSALPYEWVRQSAPGSVIVAPTRADYVGSGPLVRFTVDDDGQAVGKPVNAVGFMPLRQQRTPYADLSGVDFDNRDQSCEVVETLTQPWLIANSVDVRWAISTRIAPCRWGHRPPTTERPQHQLWFADNATGSWAIARYDRTGSPYQIRQSGPRHLWSEIEAAYQWWIDQGRPPLSQWQLIISSDQQVAVLP